MSGSGRVERVAESYPIVINGTEILPGLVSKKARFDVPGEDTDTILQVLRKICGPCYKQVRISDADYDSLIQQRRTLVPPPAGTLEARQMEWLSRGLDLKDLPCTPEVQEHAQRCMARKQQRSSRGLEKFDRIELD